MFHDILFLILGLVLIIAGGNYLTDGAVSVAKRFGISSLVIGLTIVAFGSSTPDFCSMLHIYAFREIRIGARRRSRRQHLRHNPHNRHNSHDCAGENQLGDGFQGPADACIVVNRTVYLRR